MAKYRVRRWRGYYLIDKKHWFWGWEYVRGTLSDNVNQAKRNLYALLPQNSIVEEFTID